MMSPLHGRQAAAGGTLDRAFFAQDSGLQLARSESKAGTGYLLKSTKLQQECTVSV